MKLWKSQKMLFLCTEHIQYTFVERIKMRTKDVEIWRDREREKLRQLFGLADTAQCFLHLTLYCVCVGGVLCTKFECSKLRNCFESHITTSLSHHFQGKKWPTNGCATWTAHKHINRYLLTIYVKTSVTKI